MYQNISQLRYSLNWVDALPSDITDGDIVTAVAKLDRKERIFVEKHWGLKRRTTAIGLSKMEDQRNTYFQLRDRRKAILQKIHELLLPHEEKRRETA